MNEELLKRLDVLAAKLNTSAQFLWNVLIKQARVTLIEDILFIGLTAGFSWIVLKWTRNYYKRHDDDFFDGNPGEWLSLIFSWVIGIIMLGFSIACIFEIPTVALNPEFWALQQVLSQLK